MPESCRHKDIQIYLLCSALPIQKVTLALHGCNTLMQGLLRVQIHPLALRNVWDKKPTDWLLVCLVSTKASWPKRMLPDLKLCTYNMSLE